MCRNKHHKKKEKLGTTAVSGEGTASWRGKDMSLSSYTPLCAVCSDCLGE